MHSHEHGWLNRQKIAMIISEFGRTDAWCMGVAIASIVGWVAAPDVSGLAALHLAAGLATLWRLSRWQGWTIRRYGPNLLRRG